MEDLNNKKILLFTTLVMFAVLSVYSQNVPQGLQYNVSGQNIQIISYNGNATTLEIPNEIEGLQVTSINDSAFSMKTRLTSVTFERANVTFNNNAFQGNLRESYVSDGIGTYTRVSGGQVWRKQ